MKIIYNILAVLGLVSFIIACNEDPELSVLKDVYFTGPVTVSDNTIVLEEKDSAENVLLFNWPAVDYYIGAPVTYFVQFTTPEDAATWANAVEVEAGGDELSLSITGKRLNKVAADLGLEPGIAHQLICRAKSFVDRPAFSNPVTITVTPYEVFKSFPSLWVPGAYQGWNPASAPVIVSKNFDDVFEGYLYFPAGEIKLTAQDAWEPMAYGDGGNGVLIEANYAGGNFNVAEEGYYLVAADLNEMRYLLVKVTWGIIGGATPGGWSTDTPMTYDAATNKWTVTCDMIADGSFKFRANGGWTYDFGKDDNGNLEYCNHPWKSYVDRPQFTVPSDGNYTITLDLSRPGDYRYSITKNN